MPLAPGETLTRLARDRRVAAAAPLAFGDIVRGYPVIGTTPDFATRWGRIAPSDGRLFEAEDEAVIGAQVRLAIGEDVTPSHASTGVGCMREK